MELRTCATFQSSRFNTTEPREYFLNPGCFGDDCAQWLVALLRTAGVPGVAEPWQEDWGWQTRAELESTRVLISIGLVPADPPHWLLMLDEERSLRARLFGRAHPQVVVRLAEAIHRGLAAEQTTRALRWYTKADWDAGRLDQGVATPR